VNRVRELKLFLKWFGPDDGISTGEQKYYVSNLPAHTPIKTLAAARKARWVCEQAHQQLKEELGLDHFEVQVLDSLTSTRPDDNDRLRLSPIRPPQRSGESQSYPF